jgi:hypothetical protein
MAEPSRRFRGQMVKVLGQSRCAPTPYDISKRSYVRMISTPPAAPRRPPGPPRRLPTPWHADDAAGGRAKALAKDEARRIAVIVRLPELLRKAEPD